MNKKEYMKEYFKRPEIKEKNRMHSREYMRRKRHPPENKIKNLERYLENINKYPTEFPQAEFNKKLIKMLENGPQEIEEKKLKDMLYDILDKKGVLSPVRIIQIYNSSLWANTIEEFMRMNDYLRQENRYILMDRRFISQNEQK
jgi:hypothetical protein